MGGKCPNLPRTSCRALVLRICPPPKALVALVAEERSDLFPVVGNQDPFDIVRCAIHIAQRSSFRQLGSVEYQMAPALRHLTKWTGQGGNWAASQLVAQELLKWPNPIVCVGELETCHAVGLLHCEAETQFVHWRARRQLACPGTGRTDVGLVGIAVMTCPKTCELGLVRPGGSIAQLRMSRAIRACVSFQMLSEAGRVVERECKDEEKKVPCRTFS
jgi:hypothetical protein